MANFIDTSVLSPAEGGFLFFNFYSFSCFKLYLLTDLERVFLRLFPEVTELFTQFCPVWARVFACTYTPQGAKGRAVWAQPWASAPLTHCQAEVGRPLPRAPASGNFRSIQAWREVTHWWKDMDSLWGVCVCTCVCMSVPWAACHAQGYVRVHVQGCVFECVWRRAPTCRGVHAWGVHRGVHARMWVHVWSERNGCRGIFQILALFTRASLSGPPKCSDPHLHRSGPVMGKSNLTGHRLRSSRARVARGRGSTLGR